jgi:hypothetical protein
MVLVMRGRILKVTIVLTGLAGGVYAADLATAPAAPVDVGQVILAQQVNEGQLVKAGQAERHQVGAYTADQMLDLSETYDKEMRAAVEHAEDVRILAYHSRDIIRMTCIDDKLAQIKAVLNVAQPRFLTLRTLKTAELVMREQFSVINQAHERIAELSAQVDGCLGDNLDAVSIGRIQEETAPNDNINDPTRPPSPNVDVTRPPEASPYN